MERVIKNRRRIVLSALMIATVCVPGVVQAAPANAIKQVGILDSPAISADLKVNPDLFLKPNLSVGEASLLITDPVQTWHAARARLWMGLPDSDTSHKLFLQAGVGFLEPDLFLQSQSALTVPSLLVPLGVGMDYGLSSRYSFTTMLSLDVSEVRSGLGAGTHVAPGLTFGFRF